MSVPLSHSTAPLAIPDGWSVLGSGSSDRGNPCLYISHRYGRFSYSARYLVDKPAYLIFLIGKEGYLGVLPSATKVDGSLGISANWSFSATRIVRALDIQATATFDFIEKQDNVLVFKRREQSAESEGQI